MQTSPLSDTQDTPEDFAFRAANGDEQAFTDLILRYERVIRDTLTEVVAPEDAGAGERLLECVVKELYGKIAGFSGQSSSFKEWLQRTTKHIYQGMGPETLLLEQAKSGDSHAFGKLMMAYRPVICYVARKYLPYMQGFGDEDDIFHEVVLRAQQAIAKFDGNSRALKSWLSITTGNLCKEIIRKIHPHVGGLQIRMIDVEDFVSRLFSHEPDPARTVVAQEELGCAARAFASLSQKHQDVLREKYGEDLKYKEIAQKFNIPIGTVSKRIHTAMQQFRKHLDVYEKHGITDSKGMPHHG